MSVAAGKQRKKAWSLAAAARTAREARIAAVRYMQEAAIEREWHATTLAYGHQARAARTDNPDRARAMVFATMGYPPPYPDSWDQASAMMLADEARYLGGADLYVLTPQMLDVVTAAAQSLTFADLGLLREDDLPSPSGAVVLPRPLITRHQSGSLYRDVAFTWRSPSQVPLPGGMGFRRAELPAVRMSEYTIAPRSNRGFMRAARAQRVALPPMLLEVVWSLPLHPDTPGQAHDYDLLADALRRLNAAYWQEEARNKEAGDQDQAVGEYASGAILDQGQDGTFGSRFLYAFWRLCEQQIGAVQAAPAGHSAQVTAARAGVNPDVRVVALRRAGPSGPPAGQAGPHQWHHHWVVRMHKVRQWYPSLQQHKVMYRGPFLKGDRHGQAAARRGCGARAGQVSSCLEAARASRPQTCRSGGHELTAPSQAAKLPDKFCADLLACPGPANRLTPGMLYGMTPIRASSGLTTPAVAIPSGPIAAGIT